MTRQLKAPAPASDPEKKLFGIKELAVGRSDTFRLSLDDLHVKAGWNSREVDFDPADEIDLALARSIAESGVKETLTAIFEDGKVFITNGHRRRAAALYARDVLGADIKSVPVQTEARYSNEADRVLSQIIRNDGKPLSPFEKGKVFKRLTEFGWSPDDIATKTGLTKTRVTQLLEVQAAPEAVKTLVREGAVSADLALKTVKSADGDAAKAVAALQGAVRTAKEAGKTRATAKHMGEAGAAPRDTLKAATKALLVSATIEEPEADGEDFVVVRIRWADYRRWRDALDHDGGRQ